MMRMSRRGGCVDVQPICNRFVEDEYDLESVVGEGSFGRVFYARGVSDAKEVDRGR